MKYDQVFDGEWITPRHKGWRMKCCECSLIHVVDFKIAGKAVMLRATRDMRATRRARENR